MSLKVFLAIVVVNTIQAHLWNNDFILKYLLRYEPEYSRGNKVLSGSTFQVARRSPSDEMKFKYRQYEKRYYRLLNSKDGQFSLYDFLTAHEGLRHHS